MPVRIACDAGKRALLLRDDRAAAVVLDALVPVLAPAGGASGDLEAPKLAAS